MEINIDRVPECEMTELLQVASSIIGMPVADVEALLSTELNTDHLVGYIIAVMSKRMN